MKAYGIYYGQVLREVTGVQINDQNISVERISALTAERDRLREALAFYAAEENWQGGFAADPPRGIKHIPSAVDRDDGKIARAALQEEAQ